MRRLKLTLYAVYPILIILLLVTNCHGCHREHDDDNSSTADSTTVEAQHADANTLRQAQETGGTGDLKVTLLWNFEGDIDLYVKQPNGRTIYYQNKRDIFTGGYLDVDNRRGGQGATENIYWQHPPKGTYTISLDYFQQSVSTRRAEAGTCSVVVIQKDKQPKKYDVYMNAPGDNKRVATVTVE